MLMDRPMNRQMTVDTVSGIIIAHLCELKIKGTCTLFSIHFTLRPLCALLNQSVSLDASTSSSCSDIPGMSVLRDHLNIVHLNIQSLYPKRDILEVEIQFYD